MERKPNAAWHECMRLEGKGAECADCPALIQGHCESFTGTLAKMAFNLDSRYRSKLPLQERDLILSKTVAKVLENLKKDAFKGEAKFTTWAWAIFKNTRTDSMRAVKSQREILVSLSQLFKNKEDKGAVEESVFRKRRDEQEAAKEIRKREQDAHQIVFILKKNLPYDPTGCARLYLDLFYAWEEGNLDRDVAAEYGYKPNTLTVKKRRCRDVIQNLIEAENG